MHNRYFLVFCLLFLIGKIYGQGTVHIIHYADTKGIGGIGATCREGVNFVNYEIVDGIRAYSGMKVEHYLVTSDDFKKGKMSSRLKNISTQTYDVILFFYEGHESNAGESDWPTFSFTGFSGGASFDYMSAYHILKNKPNRLLLMFVNSCNKLSAASNGGRRRTAQFSNQSIEKARYIELFQKTSGVLLMSSSKKGQVSRAVQGELSYFYSAFRKAFRSAVTGSGKASWKTIMNDTYSSTQKIASDDGYTQTPIYYNKLEEIRTAPQAKTLTKTEQYKLGDKYYYGKGVSKDYKQAVYWYRKAADQGYAGAIRALK